MTFNAFCVFLCDLNTFNICLIWCCKLAYMLLNFVINSNFFHNCSVVSNWTSLFISVQNALDVIYKLFIPDSLLCVTLVIIL